jgi:hypothetical protein
MAYFQLYEDIIPLQNVDEEKPITLGTNNKEAWALKAIRITSKDPQVENIRFDESDDGPRKRVYRLKLREGQSVRREIECERYFPNSVVDNHVFSDGAQKIRLSFYVDENLHGRKDLWANPIGLDLPEKEKKSDWMSPEIRGHRRRPDLRFCVYSCNPNCVFLPHQGVTYSVSLA